MMREETVDCLECGGSGMISTMGCCGNTVNGECRGDCCIEVPEQCSQCCGMGSFKQLVQPKPMTDKPKTRYKNPETGEVFYAHKLSDVPQHIRLTSKCLRNKKANRAKAKRNKKGKR